MTWTRRVLLLRCLVPAVVLIVLRITRPEVGVAVRPVSFAPLAVVLYLVAFLLSLGKAALAKRDQRVLAVHPQPPAGSAQGWRRVLGITLPRVVQIDHVLVGPKLTVLDARTVAIDGTGHAGVLAEVALG